MKHAFLIIAHNEFEVLQRLLAALDNERIDFFIHIDKKVKEMPKLTVSKSGLYFTKERIDTRWGHVSQIKTEISLFMAAYSPGQYVFYHLISGVHYPIKSTEKILAYYDSLVGNTVFSVIGKDAPFQEEIKIHRFNLFTKGYASGPRFKQKLCQILWRITNSFQGKLKIHHLFAEEFYKAPNWASFSEQALKYLIMREKSILSKYKWSFCGDEYFAPTELMASPLRDSLHNSKNILFQVFGPASPRTLQIDDFDEIVGSDCLFARKLSSLHIDVIERIEGVKS